jgi:hypothetical protein
MLMCRHSGQPITVTECVVPQFVGVNFQPADLGNAAPPFMEFGLSIAVDSSDFCSTFATVGSAVAGKCFTTFEVNRAA